MLGSDDMATAWRFKKGSWEGRKVHSLILPGANGLDLPNSKLESQVPQSSTHVAPIGR